MRVTLGQSLFATGATAEGLALGASGLHVPAMQYEQIGRGDAAERAVDEALRLA